MEAFELDILTARERDDLRCGKKIVETYAAFNVCIEISYIDPLPDWTVYHLKLRDSTTEDQLEKYAKDVQSRLKIRQFQLIRSGGLTPCIAVCDHEVEYASLISLLSDPECRRQLDKAQLPHLVGFGVTSKPIIGDLAEYPHIIVGGAPNSGKTTALHALITTMACIKTPAEVNFVLIDTGATGLRYFDGMPHLAGPVIRTKEAAYRALAALRAEMERRIDLEETGPDAFAKLPRIVLAFDEFPSIFLELSKGDQKALRDRISAILQRGRHGKMHVVAAAQNPTLLNMKVDTGNFAAQLAFRCARENFSRTILGEKGAEQLLGKGDALFRAPQNGTMERIQGVNIPPDELCRIVQVIKQHPYNPRDFDLKFTIPQEVLKADGTERGGVEALTPIVAKPPVEDQVFAKVLAWALGQNNISVNATQGEFHMGWSKANELVKRLESLGIVDKLDAKLPRHVVPTEIRDLPSEMLDFLDRNGISEDEVHQAFAARDNARIT